MKTKELRQAIIDNPDLDIVTMVHYEVCASDDWQYWLGKPKSFEITNLWAYGEQVFTNQSVEDLEEKIYEILDDEFEMDILPQDRIEKMIRERMDSMIKSGEIQDKGKVICIYVNV